MQRMQILFIAVLSSVLFGCSSGDAPTEKSRPDPGTTKLPRFETRPEKLETIDESEYMVLKDDFAFIDSMGVRWFAPAGTRTDGASIPQCFLSFIGDRFDPRYRAAALVHDAFCQDINQSGASYQTRSWREVHTMFYEACVEGGVDSKTAQLMLAAVWLGGPRWNDDAHMLDDVPEDVLHKEFGECKEWLEKDDRTNEQLIAWMDKREPELKKGVSPPFPQK
jgi:hypothetical protein